MRPGSCSRATAGGGADREDEAVMVDERRSPRGGAMSAERIEHELAMLRAEDDGTPGLRASVLNLIVVTDEASAREVSRMVSGLAGRYPCRAIVLISDPEAAEASLDIGVAAFCSARGGVSSQVCAEQVTVHAEGPPAAHLRSIAGPLLLPDLPTFLWYPGHFSPEAPEFAGLAALADRLIVDSATSGDAAASLRGLSALLESSLVPAVGDLQWVALTPWRALIADLFDSPERSGELGKVRRMEVMHRPEGECRALLLVGWLASSLGWRFVGREGRKARFEGPEGEISVDLSPESPDARLRRVRLYSEELSFQVSRRRALSDVRTTVMRGDEVVAERAVSVGAFDRAALLAEELRFRSHDAAYEAALRVAREVSG
jgi:glucose-6-phosphate dehydrogenase assembly protein OpcA